MRTRVSVAFWGATVPAILFLGASWNAAARALSGAGDPVDVVVAALAGIGLLACLVVAGRIAFVTGRALHRATRT